MNLPEPAVKAISVVAIVIGAFVVSRVARWAIGRAMRSASGPGARRLIARTPSSILGTSQLETRAEARIAALTTVFRSLASILVWFVAVVWVLRVLGVDPATLLASAGLIGVALGFGAQNVVRDVLAGFFVLVEDQFGVGDVVDLGGDAKGTVESVTLRATNVRDVHGTLWHVPNGQIQRVANKSQQWSRALLDLEVDIDTDYALAQRVVQEVAEDLAAEEAWRSEILGAPEVWGIEAFTAEGYMIRIVLKTLPASQFGVLRELRIRVLAAFTDAGIRFPASRPELWVHTTTSSPAPGREPRRDASTGSGASGGATGGHVPRGDASEG